MLDPTKAAQEWDNIKKQIITMLERRGGVIITARKWGERKLAYEIKGHKRAAYLLIYFQAPPENITTLKRDLLLSEIVMRTLILAHPQTTPKDQFFDDKQGEEGSEEQKGEMENVPEEQTSKETDDEEGEANGDDELDE